MKLPRITLATSPFSTLQQRLAYVDAHPDRAWSLILETVPQWPRPIDLAPLAGDAQVASYAPPAGDRELVDAICEYERGRGRRLAPASVLVTHGGQNGLSMLFRALARPGGRALCSAPMLRSLARTIRLAGVEPEYFSLEGGALDLERILERCTPDVAFVYVNTPMNPTGEVVSPMDMQALVELLAHRRIPLVVDTVYDGFLFDGAAQLSPLDVHGDWSQLYVVQSMSKNFGAPGLRIGWLVTAPQNVERLAGELEREHISISGVTQRHAAALVRHGNHALVRSVDERRRGILDELARQPRISYRPPAGGALIALAVPAEDVELFGDFLMIEHGLVAVTSGHYEHAAPRAFLRFPLGIPVDAYQAALRTISRALAEFSAATRDHTGAAARLGSTR